MYTYLNRMGELYFIEVLQDNAYKPIGDVTFWQEDMPIVIGDKSYRGKGIGKKVVRALVARGKALGFQKMYVADIYSYNQGSRRCFESVGFREYAKPKWAQSICWTCPKYPINRLSPAIGLTIR